MYFYFHCVVHGLARTHTFACWRSHASCARWSTRFIRPPNTSFQQCSYSLHYLSIYYLGVPGKEKPPKLIAGIIIARRNATFLRLLHESYRSNYRWWDWDYNCARLSYQLYLKRPDLLHVEPTKLTTPDWTDRDQLWNGLVDWSDLYVVHVMAHFEHSHEVYTPLNIRAINSTFGQLMRYVYYGSPALIAASWRHRHTRDDVTAMMTSPRFRLWDARAAWVIMTIRTASIAIVCGEQW